MVDSKNQKILIKPCINCTKPNFRPENYLTIICKDNKGNGNMASSSLFLYFRNELKNYIKDHYYLLATGPKNTDIPYLVLKVIHFALFYLIIRALIKSNI
jgi:hypothetical protein